VVETLAAAGALAATTGIIVGRRAAESDSSIIRLGKVARRLLRRLDSPVFVVPPDLERAAIGAGPIVCAVDLDPIGVAVARFGERLGRAIGRPTRLVHVVESGDPIGLEYLPEGTWNNLRARRAEVGQAELDAWRDEAGLSAYTVLAEGQTVPKLLGAARELDACMILCGSRRLSVAQRMWMSSVGSTLAAGARVAVGVVA
jgi:nucleotide-binding universal stress UspA family protein